MCVWSQVVGHVLITFQRSPLKQIRKSSQRRQQRQQPNNNIYGQQFAFENNKKGNKSSHTLEFSVQGTAEASQSLVSRAF